MSNIIAIIPARLASTRFPRKVLYDFYGLPMVEHVRRRGVLSGIFKEVYVATCDMEIADIIRSYGGKVLMTSDQHINGTSRSAEAVSQIDCDHVILLQGDEPLILTRHLKLISDRISNSPRTEAWNLTAPISDHADLDRRSFVKCSVTKDNDILYCFRRSPSVAEYKSQLNFIQKMLGIMAFRKDFLISLAKLEPTTIELGESIEQMRILENRYVLKAVSVKEALPSVNELEDLDDVLHGFKNSPEQIELLAKTLD